MKFLKIKYLNYRCFKDLSLDFKTKKDKNISLVIAPNGGGKTEMLFSFWWVLYDFDFSTLKEKKDTPYALNSSLYFDLINAEELSTEECYILLEFEFENIIYRIKRTETYTKTRNGMETKQEVELSSYKDNGETTLPERDKEVIQRRLSKLIPKKILHGIIFDGERMKELNSIDDNAKVAIEGVIQHITNEELYEICKIEFKNQEKINSQNLKKFSNKRKEYNIEKIVKELEYHKQKEQELIIKIDGKKQTLSDVELKLENISKELKRYDDSKENEIKRQLIKKNLEDKRKELDNKIEDFYKTLDSGYLLISFQLLNDVEILLKKYDIPEGLTVDAVKSILNSEKCICGNDIHEKEKRIISAFIDLLPPDNVNSTIFEMVRQSKMAIDKERDSLLLLYSSIIKDEKAIETIKQELVDVSIDILANSTEIIKKLEKDNSKYSIQKVDLDKELKGLNEEKLTESKYIIICENNKREALAYNDNYKQFFSKDVFINKCLSALNDIDEYNKRISLKNINEKINDSYSMLSEDYSRGRRLYIVQFNEAQKYRLVSYYLDKYESTYNIFLNDGTIKSYYMMSLGDEEIKEKVILSVLESNSTGQSKINSLAFAKSILDYSNEKRGEESMEISRDYPFLIDSPFTELSDNNLINSAKNITKFSNQIILLISNESLSGIKELIDPFISTTSYLIKRDNESSSYLKEVN